MAKKHTAITFLIPTYKGKHLLEKNLPSVLAQMQAGDELLISEDAAGNLENLRYFRQKYDLQLIPDVSAAGQLYRARISEHGKPITISFFQRYRCGRFARNVNDAVALIDNDYFLLLNNDVRPRTGVRDNLWAMMQNGDSVFAVSACEIDVNHGGQVSGRNQLWWSKGRFWHRRDDNLDHSGETAWACGGSSLFDITKWRLLGGFDTKFYPAYWEDIDISYSARARGWQVLYCHKAVVEHVHETTNKDVFGEEKIAAMSWRGGTKFAWKHARGRQKWQFLFFYWYWQLKQFPALRLWAVVLIAALVTRLGLLEMPRGLTVDEAALAYNGISVWETRRDEWLNFLPVTFRSFGDYKAPLAVYLVGASQLILGRQIWAVRLPFALAGVMSVWLVMKLTDLLLREKNKHHLTYAALAGALLTLSWWHFHFSHLGFESGLALVFQLAAIYGLTKFGASETDDNGNYWADKWWCGPLMGSMLALVAALYSYHSAKITVLLILLAVVALFGRRLRRCRRVLLAPVVVGVVLLTPLFQDSFCEVAPERPFTLLAWSQSVDGQPHWQGGVCGDGQLTGKGLGLSRGSSSFLSDESLSVGEKWSRFSHHYGQYLSPDFLWGGATIDAQVYGRQAANVRHGDATFGVLWWAELPLLLILLATVVIFADWRRQYGKVALLGLALFLGGLVPAAITDQIPHSNQALPAVVGVVILDVLALVAWRRWWRARAMYYPSCVMMTMVIITLEWMVAWVHYQQIFAPVSQVAVTTGEQVRAGRIGELQKDAAYLFAVNLLDVFADLSVKNSEFDQIIFASSLEQPYIYALLAEHLSPEAYRFGKLSEKYMFTGKLTSSHLQKSKTAVIYSPLEIDEHMKAMIASQCAHTNNYYFGPWHHLAWCITKTAPVTTLETELEESE